MNRDLALVGLSLATWGVGEGMFIFFAPLYMEEMGANPAEIGVILGAIGVVMMAAHLPAGYLADRIGRRPMLIAAWCTGTLATGLMALAPSLGWFVAGNALYGATAFVSSPLSSYITAARSRWSVGRALTLVSAMYNVGATVGPLLGGWIGDRFGLQNNFRVAALIFVVSTLLILLIRPQPVEATGNLSPRTRLGSLLTSSFRSYLVVIFLGMFSMYLAQPLSQNFLRNERGVSLLQMGGLISARSLGVVGLNLVLGQLPARLGYLLAQLCMAVFALLIWKGAGLGWYTLGYIFLGSYMTARSLVNAQGRNLTNAGNMGLAYGVLESTMATAMILAPPVAGFIYHLNPAAVYPTSLLLILPTFLYAWFRLPHNLKAGEGANPDSPA